MHAADPAVERRLAEVALAHHLGAGLAGVHQSDYLPPELLGELPGVLRIPHGASLPRGALGLSSDCSNKYSHIITEFRLPGDAGKCYLSVVLDCFDGRPVAWSVGASPTARLANSSLEAACSTLSPGERPVVHSDRGGHCRWPGWIGICRENRLVRSMSRKGRSCDNARMEGFFGTLKREFFRGRGWEGADRDGFMVELHRWLKWFRSGRISESLGWRTPDESRRLLGYAV